MTYNDIEFKLIRCDKWNFENGEKRKFSGFMQRWVQLNKSHPDAYDTWIFIYKQPVIYDFEAINHFPLTKKQKKLWCKNNGYYDLPFWSYNQRLTAWAIMKYGKSKHYKCYMVSGDDDIFEFEFEEPLISEVKKLIELNFKNVNLFQIIVDFCSKNNLEF